MSLIRIQHITVNINFVIYHILKTYIFSNDIQAWMTGLIFTPGFMNLLTSLPILSEGGGHKHCNLIIKLLTLALSMGLLVAG